MEPLSAAFVVAACARLDVAHVDDMAKQFALPRLRQWRPDIRAEPEVDPRHVIGGIALTRNAAQQNEAAAKAQLVAQAAKEPTERRKGECRCGYLREVQVAEAVEMIERRVNLRHFVGGKGMQSIGPIVDGAAGPCAAFLQIAHRGPPHSQL